MNAFIIIPENAIQDQLGFSLDSAIMSFKNRDRTDEYP
jgi:hypothetical protein